MKKILLFFIFFVSFYPCMRAQIHIVFDGQSLDAYMGEMVVFDQTLTVCGHYGRTLYLSYERLRSPEDVAAEGTVEFAAQQLKCDNGFLTAYCHDVWADTVRVGATVTNLLAYITDSHNMTIYGGVSFDNAERPTSPPETGDARLLLCAANLCYYCPAWQGTYGAESDEEFHVQNLKTLKALANINADLYALAEVQQGTVGLDSLVNGLNALTAPGRYTYVNDADTYTSTYTKVALIYRADKLAPAMSLGQPYSSLTYRRREYVQAFDELSTNERFVLSMNHFKAKDGTGSASTNPERMDNVQKLLTFLNNRLNINYYNDRDVLIVGDLNCASREEPIRYLEDNGYQNQLTRFSPTEYSYVFDNQVQYIDHVFASPTMAGQVTGAAPYHLNADESYRFGHYYGDTTMYRYSDHDPIVIGLKLGATSSVDEESEINMECPKIYGAGRQIVVESRQDISEDVVVYDLVGRELARVQQNGTCRIFVPIAGVYIVRCGAVVKKVLLN